MLCTSLTRFKSGSCLGACPAPACCPKPLSPLITCCPAVCQAVALPDAVPPRSPGPCLRGVYNIPGVVKCRLHDTRRNAEAATADTGVFPQLRTCHLSCLALPCLAIILEGRKDAGKGEARTHWRVTDLSHIPIVYWFLFVTYLLQPRLLSNGVMTILTSQGWGKMS